MSGCGCMCLRQVRRYCQQINKLSVQPVQPGARFLSSLPPQKDTPDEIQQKANRGIKTYVKDTDIRSEYGLVEDQLEGIPYKNLRTGYEGEKTDFPDEKYASKLYLRSQVVRRAMDIYKTELNMHYQRKKYSTPQREEEDITDAITNLLSILRREDRELKSTRVAPRVEKGSDEMLRSQMISSLKVVGVSISTNLIVAICKLGSYFITGSASMLSESIHSFVDTFNQLFMGYGLVYSMKRPHSDHPYGFSKARYIYALISGVSIFNMGAVVTIYHGVQQLYTPSLVLDHSIGWAYAVLLMSALIEGFSLYYAARQAMYQAKEDEVSLYHFIFKGNEPNTTAVLVEDCVAVAGIFIAGAALSLSAYTGNPIYDAIGSIGVGGLLGGMALFIVIKNKDNLVGKSMNTKRLRLVVDMLERDPAVLSVVDVKTTVEGPSYVRFKAEVLFNTDEIARKYISTITPSHLLKQAQSLQDEVELNDFVAQQSTLLIDTLAVEVDRIEFMIKKRFPEIRHVDLELL